MSLQGCSCLIAVPLLVRWAINGFQFNVTPSSQFAFSVQGDFFAMELLDGYLYMHLDLGKGSLKVRASNRRLDDGAWHKVEVVRNRGRGSLEVDTDSVSFETPGDAASLELTSPLYVGGLDPNVEAVFVPPVVWSAGFRKGFVGELKRLKNTHNVVRVLRQRRNTHWQCLPVLTA